MTAFSWQQGDDSQFTGTGRGRSWVARAGDYAAGLSGSGRHDAVAIAAPLSHGSNPNSNAAGRRREDDENLVTAFMTTESFDSGVNEDISPTLRVGTGVGAPSAPGVQYGSAVRRLTPTECCRLQGFPDDWLGTPNEKPDSPRYAALGDAVTVPVAEWIGQRILEAAA